MKSKIYLSYLTMILLMSLNGYSQNSLSTDKITCKLGITSMNSISAIEFNGGTYLYKEKKPHYQLQLSYNINKIVDLGLYFGYSKLFQEVELPYDAEKGYYVLESNDGTRRIIQLSHHLYKFDSHTFSYGLKSNIHILPILFDKHINRLDLYLAPTVGLVSESYININDKTINKPNFFSYGIGIGTHYLFTKHLGVFGEYHLGHFYNQSNSQWKAGLVFKF